MVKKIEKSFHLNSKLEKIKKLISKSEYIKHECDEFKRYKKTKEKEIENVLKNVNIMNHKLEKLLINYKYNKTSFYFL